MQSQPQGNIGGVLASGESKPSSLLAGYQPLAGVYDELLDAGGVVRSHWAPFVAHLDQIGAKELGRRWSHSQRLIYENGVAYAPHKNPAERHRPWTLDPLPILITREQWNGVSEGLAQRVELLELLLQDLYGPQTLLRTGVLPAELLYRHPGYLLPLCRQAAGLSSEAQGRMLRFYAADLGRAPTGAWWVLADRSEAPSGLGYALENRIVVSRMLPAPFRDCGVRRLAEYFLRFRETLASIAPQQRANPRVALLSQGSGRPNYFEDAYLARYLGYTLVEGEDLTVRDRRLWLKTLEGLAPIDILLRRPSTEQCEPLELGGVSPAGVAGMFQSARDGSLSIVNAPGSGLVESPVFMAFMPRICQALLKEELKLPGVATWWCGETASLDHVLLNLENLILRPAYRRREQDRQTLVDLNELTLKERAERIRREPRDFVAQERVERCSAPTWQHGAVTAARVALRAFTIVSDEACHVLEGALGRTTLQSVSLEKASLQGEGSKDVWIVSDEPVEPITLLLDDDASIELVRLGAELPSRVADNSYWLGRQLERADSKARLVRTVAKRISGEHELSELQELPPLLRALAEQGQIEPGYAVDELRNLLPYLDRSLPGQVLNREQPGSLGASIDAIFASASKVRDRLSADTWRILLRVSDAFRLPNTPVVDLTDLMNAIDELIVDLAAVGGMVVESMTRTQFYRFLDIGRRLERAMQLVDLLQACLVDADPMGATVLEALLEASESLMTYRSRYRANLKFRAVLDLLVTDASNPRSLAFQLEALERHVGKLPRQANEAPGAATEQRIAMSMAHAVRVADVAALADGRESVDRAALKSLLDQIANGLPALSDAISLKYLVHAETPRQLSPL